jgi:hypothetical protein
VGFSALTANTTASYNNAVGVNALTTNTTGNANFAGGWSALYSNTTGASNVAIGHAALNLNTTASNNTAVGANSLQANTTGTQNVAVGALALDASTTLDHSTAVGYGALTDQSSGNGRNTAMGYLALENVTSGDSNVGVGYLVGSQLTTGDANVFIGGGEHGLTNPAGYAVTSGNANTFIGHSAGSIVTTGSNNTILGSYNGNQGGLDIRTSNNDIVLSDGDGFPRAHFDGGETWSFSCGASNALTEDRVSIDKSAMYSFPDAGTTLGYAAYRWGQIYSSVGSISTSDARDKTSVTALTADEIQASKLLAKEIGTYQWLASIEEKGADNARHHVGITVQRAIEIMKSCNLDPMRYGFICYDAWEKDDLPLLEAGDRYGFRYEQLNQFLAAGFNARLEALES